MSRTKVTAPGNGGQKDSATGKRKYIDANPTQSTKRVIGEKEAKRQKTTTLGGSEQSEIDQSIALQSPDELSTRFVEAITKHKGDLSTIELEDQSLPASTFQDTTKFTESRLIKNLSQFLETYTEGGSKELQSCQREACPHTIIITTSAIRTTHLIREVRRFGSEQNKIAKLFAKHMKLSPMKEYVQKTRFGIGAGTPQRIHDLIDQGALQIDQLKRVVIDGSYLDEKRNTIFTQGDIFLQTVNLLNLESLKLRLVSGEAGILVF